MLNMPGWKTWILGGEPKGEKVGEVGVKWRVEVHVSLWGETGAGHTGSIPRAWSGAKIDPRPSICWTAGRDNVLWRVLGCGCVLSLGDTWKCRHVGDTFSSPNSSTSPGGRGHGAEVAPAVPPGWRPQQIPRGERGKAPPLGEQCAFLKE